MISGIRCVLLRWGFWEDFGSKSEQYLDADAGWPSANVRRSRLSMLGHLTLLMHDKWAWGRTEMVCILGGFCGHVHYACLQYSWGPLHMCIGVEFLCWGRVLFSCTVSGHSFALVCCRLREDVVHVYKECVSFAERSCLTLLACYGRDPAIDWCTYTMCIFSAISTLFSNVVAAGTGGEAVAGGSISA